MIQRIETVHPDGTVEVDHVTVADPPPPTAGEILAALPPAEAAAIVDLSSQLLTQAGPLWEACSQIALTNTARPALELLSATVLVAALPLLDT